MLEPKNTRFVKIHPNSSCLFNGAEISFLILLLDQEFLRDMGYNSAWSRSYFQKYTGVSNATFTKCVERLEGIGILSSSQNRTGEKKKYRLNYAAYEKTMILLDTTNNREALRSFCNNHFSNATISDVTEDQLLQLRKTKKQVTIYKNDMVGGKTIAENNMVSNIMDQDTKNMSKMILVPESMVENDMVYTGNSETTIKNDMVSEIYNKTMLVFDMVSEMKQKLDIDNPQTIAENDMLLLKDILTVYKNDTVSLKNVRTMSETTMVSGGKCETIIKEEASSRTNYMDSKSMIENDTLSKISGKSISENDTLLGDNSKSMVKNDMVSVKNGIDMSKNVRTMSESDMVLSENDADMLKNVRTMSENDISIDNIYNNININSKNNIIEDISDNYKNASERSIFSKGGEALGNLENKRTGTLTSSQNQKFIDSLIRDMKEEFPEGDRPKREELRSFFSELKEDYFSHDPELSQLTIEDIFPYFQSSGVRVYTYYSEHVEKTDEEIRQEFMSLPVSEDCDESLLKLSDQEKIEIIKEDFRASFPVDEKVELEEMAHYVAGYMRDLELMKVDRVLYDSPQLLIYMFPELRRDKDSKLWYRTQNKPQDSTIGGNDGKFIRIQPKFKEEAENERIISNPFYDRLKKYRFPRITVSSSGTCNASEIIPKVLTDLGYENGMYVEPEVMDQILDVIIDKFKLQGRSFEPFQNIWLYCDKYHHKQKGKILITNLPENKKMKA